MSPDTQILGQLLGLLATPFDVTDEAHLSSRALSDAVGIVAIGRNEGDRLVRCLDSITGRGSVAAQQARVVAHRTRVVVYVDSGSSDASRENAHAAGARVVELDLSRPFTAARARNAGFEELMRTAPTTEFVQFVDGDCELDPTWIEKGVAELRARPDVGVVCGRRRERAREASVFNRLCDMEWDTPVGVARACGGDALMRVDAFRAVGGYDDAMIAGEEPDLCLRLARRGYSTVRIDAEMTRHDAAMTRWTQWWQRAVRTGHTTAELLAKHGAASEHRRLRRALSAIAWAVVLPSLTAVTIAMNARDAMFVSAVLVLALFLYAGLLVRIARRCRAAGRSAEDARAYAWSCALAKWPETWGMLLYTTRRAFGRRAHWIEYKDVPASVLQPIEDVT